jgi:hypothetical protein
MIVPRSKSALSSTFCSPELSTVAAAFSSGEPLRLPAVEFERSISMKSAKERGEIHAGVNWL